MFALIGILRAVPRLFSPLRLFMLPLVWGSPIAFSYAAFVLIDWTRCGLPLPAPSSDMGFIRGAVPAFAFVTSLRHRAAVFA